MNKKTFHTDNLTLPDTSVSASARVHNNTSTKASLLSAIADFAPLILGRRYLSRSRGDGAHVNRSNKHVKSLPFAKRIWHWLRSKFAWFLLLAALISGLATYAAMSEIPPLGNDPNLLIWLLNVDMAILLLFVALIAKRVVSIWSGRKRGLAGSHLQVRLVTIFSLLAAIPAIVMTIFSAFFFHFGIQAWFSQRVQTAINESQAVAQAYLEEHQQVIRADTLAMANDLDRQFNLFAVNNEALRKIVETQSVLRNLSEAIVFNGNGDILARSRLTFTLEFDDVPQYALERARTGDVVILTGENEDRVRALMRLNNFSDTYLFVGRMIDPKVLGHLDATQKGAQDYENLQMRYSSLQLTSTMIFVVIGLLMVLAAIWFGLLLARQLVSPISGLMTAAERVRGGDLSVRVEEEKSLREFELLGRAFNRMTQQIEEQQGALIEANRLMDRRRRFTETVLAGVTSGVIGVDENGLVNLANNSAARLLGMETDSISGMPIADILPDIDSILVRAHSRPQKITQDEIPFAGQDNEKHVFLVRVAIEMIGDEDRGAIITFDDITELQSAQRKAAWADVARRIAHEIKNPLTPIQLSAERLRRKYLGQIEKDREIFEQCTDTIIRHVGDIGNMVNEFSSFARMPEANLKQGDIKKHIESTVILQKQARPDISIDIKSKANISTLAFFDNQQIRQAITNMVQNAIDAIDEKAQGLSEDIRTDFKGKIQILLQESDSDIIVTINDNGTGFPEDHNLKQLLEPYVTHKVKGTGLGLAIVKKIMDDHHGKLSLGVTDDLSAYKNDLYDGAVLSLHFPKAP